MNALGRPLLCLSCHGQRLATLLETSAELRLYMRQERGYVLRQSLLVPGGSSERAVVLQVLGSDAGLLVCGGLTRQSQLLLERGGVRVLGWMCGPLRGVLRACRLDCLGRLGMPGCPGCAGRGGRGGRGGNHGQGGM